MKKLLLATAVAALSLSAAHAAPQVYGKAFLTLDLQDGDDEVSNQFNTRTQLNSNGSRIGFKGSENLTANTDLVYQLEYGLKIDDNSTQFRSRDTYLGLANKQYGTLLAGRLTAIDDMINYANVTEGGVIGGDDILATFNARRANNTLAYVSPSYNGTHILGMYVLDENNSTDNLGRDAFGIGVKHEPNGAAYKAGATYIQAGDTKVARVSGAYDLNGATTLGGLYQYSDLGTNDNEHSFTVSAEHKLTQTPWTAYGQIDFVDNQNGVNNAESQRLVVGGKYAFNSNTIAHAYGAIANTEAGAVDGKAYGIGAGLEYKF